MIQHEKSLSAWALSKWTVKGTQWKAVPCFCWPVQQQTLQRKAKGTIGQVRMWRVWMPFMCCLTHHLHFLSPFRMPGYVLSGLEIMRTVFSLGFHCCKRKLKLDNEKQWKIYLKVNWTENKNISASLCQGEELGINLITISQEARGSGGGGGGGVGGRRGGSRFWPRCQQMHDFNRN